MYLFSMLHTLRQGCERNIRCILEIKQLLQFVQQSNNQMSDKSAKSQQPFEENTDNICRFLFQHLTLHNEKRFSW